MTWLCFAASAGRLDQDVFRTHSRVSRPGPGRSIGTIANCGCTYGMGPWFRNAASEQEFLDAYAEDAALPAVPGNGLTA